MNPKSIKEIIKRLIIRFLQITFLFTFTSVSAQNGAIQGKITDETSGEPLIGASVIIVGIGTGAAADFDGNFLISNIKPGKYILKVSFISYRTDTIQNILVETGKTTPLDIKLSSTDIKLKEVEVVAKVNRESENMLLLEQKMSLLSTQAVGAKEMSRKGISNAEAAVAQVSGVSKQEGVKNVFVRGLGDRYNFTTLNGFPIPSEDPEYKNISLDFFGSDIIQNIGVSKVFGGNNYGDAGGAIINIASKELIGDKDLNIDLSAGVNTKTIGSDFLQMDGVNYWGISTNVQPRNSYKTVYNYGNSLDPHRVNSPINNGYGFSGGKKYLLGENKNPLSFYIVGSYGTKYSYTEEKIYDTTTKGDLIKNLDGEKSTQNINQLLLGNLNFSLNQNYKFDYNFMLVHDNTQYVGNYTGTGDEFVSSVQPDQYQYNGFMIRQQSNDNLLIANQLLFDFNFSKKWKFNAGVAYNIVKGTEPDRRVDKFFRKSDTEYQLLAGDGSHIRNYTELVENDFNGKLALTYELPKKFKDDVSAIHTGYNGRFVADNFNGTEYSVVVTTLSGISTLNNLVLDNWLNQDNYDAKSFSGYARISKYNVDKFINSGYADFDYQFSPKLTANAGLKVDLININVDYSVQGGYNGDGIQTLNPLFILPNLNFKYNLNDKNTFRLGLSKTYTLPQSKEISPYQYLGLSFSSQGNQNLKPSDNYNADLKWDNYLSPSELISFTAFYKYIKNPIARAYEANGAGYFTYDNISKFATVAGVETEIRKNIFNKTNSNLEKTNKLSAGLNASYIYSDMKINIPGSVVKNSKLEGSAPYIFNFDVSYDYSHKDKSFINSLVLNYFSERIYTIGLGGFEDVVEKGVPTLNFVSISKLNKHFGIKLKANNILDPEFILSRKASDGSGNKVLNSYKKGMDLSLGVTYQF